jgi:hypothetical protein
MDELAMSELAGPDYGGDDYEVRNLGVRCPCGCGQDEWGGDRMSAHQVIVRCTEFAVQFPDWEDE